MINNNSYFNIFDQTRNKYYLKFFEKLNLNKSNNNNNKYLNINDITNIYNKKENNINNNKLNTKILINQIKTKKLNSLGYNIKIKNNDLNTLNLGKKFIENKKSAKPSELSRGIKLEKILKNTSIPESNINNIKNIFRKKNNNITAINNLNNIDNKTSNNNNNNNKKYNELLNINDNDNNILINKKKLSIKDKTSSTLKNNNNNNNINFLSAKEKAFYILLKNSNFCNILPLCYQILLSKSSHNLKKFITNKEILLNYENFLKEKIKLYENKIILYKEKIKSDFIPSKIAEITLNFITTKNEFEFNQQYNKLLNKKNELKFLYYKNYIKIIYYIINESIEDEKNIELNENILLINLYNILNKKGFNNIKDYLYYFFISNNKKEKIFINNIDKINDLIKNETPKLLFFDESLKMCRFISFSLYLIREIIDYSNLIKKTIKLEIQTNEYVIIAKNKLNKFHYKYLS